MTTLLQLFSYLPATEKCVKSEVGLLLTRSGYCSGVHAQIHLVSRETFLQQFCAELGKALPVLSQGQKYLARTYTLLWDFVSNTHRSSKHNHGQGQPGCKSNVQMVFTPNHKSHPVTWNWAHSAQSSACTWGNLDSSSLDRKSSPCSEFVTNPPNQAKWPWL